MAHPVQCVESWVSHWKGKGCRPGESSPASLPATSLGPAAGHGKFLAPLSIGVLRTGQSGFVSVPLRLFSSGQYKPFCRCLPPSSGTCCWLLARSPFVASVGGSDRLCSLGCICLLYCGGVGEHPDGFGRYEVKMFLNAGKLSVQCVLKCPFSAGT